MPKLLHLVVTLLAASLVLSCATSLSRQVSDDGHFAGYYEASYDDGGVIYTDHVTIFPDGTFHTRVFASDREETWSILGVYDYDVGSGAIDFYSEEMGDDWVYEATMEADLSLFNDGETDYHYLGEGYAETVRTRDEIAGAYALSYVYDGEPVTIVMIIFADGSFYEKAIYPGEMWAETGFYELNEVTGFISFEYDMWPEGNYTGRIGPDREWLFTLEGDFHRLADDDPLGEL